MILEADEWRDLWVASWSCRELVTQFCQAPGPGRADVSIQGVIPSPQPHRHTQDNVPLTVWCIGAQSSWHLG